MSEPVVIDRPALANAVAAMSPNWAIGEESTKAWQQFVRLVQSGEAFTIPKAAE